MPSRSREAGVARTPPALPGAGGASRLRRRRAGTLAWEGPAPRTSDEDEQPHVRSPRETARLALVVALVASGLMLPWLGERSLWVPDEGRYAEIAREMLETGDFVTPRLNYVRYFEKPPLVYWMTAASMKVFGQVEWAARLPMALSGVATIVFTFLIGVEVAGATAGLLAALVLLASTGFFAVAQFVVLDMPLTGSITGGLYMVLLGLRVGRPWPWLAASAFMGLATLCKGPIGLVIPVMALFPLFLWARGRVTLARVPWLGATALFSAVTVPWFVAIGMAHPEFLNFFFVHEHLNRFLKPGHSRPGPIWYFVPVIVAGLFPWSCFLPALLRTPPRLGFPAGPFLASWTLLPLAFFSISQSKLPPYVLPIFPALAVLLGCVLARMVASGSDRDGTRDVRWAVAGCVLAAAVALAAVGLANRLSPEAYPDLVTIRQPFVVGMSALALAMLGAAASFLWRRPRIAIALVTAISAGMLWGTGQLAMQYEHEKDVKVIAGEILRERKPDERVVVYGTLEGSSALPFYLKGPVVVSGHHFGELTFARSAPEPDEKQRFADAATAQAWMHHTSPRAFFVTTIKVYESYFAKLEGFRYREIKRRGDLILYTNR
ncbi:MAG: glycosyltransferase family 39 protein [Candidatus Riflebacteria bacterium]|nr:glycosyltransferase family 39 protein [Candidatus Riflebacteria bacterium]